MEAFSNSNGRTIVLMKNNSKSNSNNSSSSSSSSNNMMIKTLPQRINVLTATTTTTTSNTTATTIITTTSTATATATATATISGTTANAIESGTTVFIPTSSIQTHHQAKSSIAISFPTSKATVATIPVTASCIKQNQSSNNTNTKITSPFFGASPTSTSTSTASTTSTTSTFTSASTFASTLISGFERCSVVPASGMDQENLFTTPATVPASTYINSNRNNNCGASSTSIKTLPDDCHISSAVTGHRNASTIIGGHSRSTNVVTIQLLSEPLNKTFNNNNKNNIQPKLIYNQNNKIISNQNSIQPSFLKTQAYFNDCNGVQIEQERAAKATASDTPATVFNRTQVLLNSVITTQNNQLNNIKTVSVTDLNQAIISPPQISIVSIGSSGTTTTKTALATITDKTVAPLNVSTVLQKTEHTSSVVSTNGNNIEMVQKAHNHGDEADLEHSVEASNPAYLYYMMTSGQCSPSDTLDSGTCSDLEITSPPPLPKKMSPKSKVSVTQPVDIVAVNVIQNINTNNNNSAVNDLINNKPNIAASVNNIGAAHNRARSLTDSEEGSESSLSCDSLNFAELNLDGGTLSPAQLQQLQQKQQPQQQQHQLQHAQLKNNVKCSEHQVLSIIPSPPPMITGMLTKDIINNNGAGNIIVKADSQIENQIHTKTILPLSFLPVSLLQDIRDRSSKLSANNMNINIIKTKHNNSIHHSMLAPLNFVSEAKVIELKNALKPMATNKNGHQLIKSPSALKKPAPYGVNMPELNEDDNEDDDENVNDNDDCDDVGVDGDDGDVDAEPQYQHQYQLRRVVVNHDDELFMSGETSFENDKFYQFHINENIDRDIVPGQKPRFFEDDETFAGYKDIHSGMSTIRSAKGTVRGVKNRVRNGIATFLQMQHANIKNYKEKDAGKVVLYTTSMGIVRETYAKCANVKQILRTLLIKFEERDVFMSGEYQNEIKERMQHDEINIPQLFVDGHHIGDAELVERLNENGELRKMLKPYKCREAAYTCKTCGGYRLLPCPACSGSKKSLHRNHFTTEFVALKCMNCDEVGLVKCHSC